MVVIDCLKINNTDEQKKSLWTIKMLVI